MRKLARLIVHVIANALGLLASSMYIPGFHLTAGVKELAVIALIFMALNIFLKPVLTLFFGPLIILTLGLGLLAINALMLYILDVLSKSLTIDSLPSLLYATAVIGLINFVFHLATHSD